MATFVLYQQNWVVVTQTIWPTKPKILATLPFTEKASWPLLQKNFPRCRCYYSHLWLGRWDSERSTPLHTATQPISDRRTVGLVWSLDCPFAAVLLNSRFYTWKGPGRASAMVPRSSEEKMGEPLVLGPPAEAQPAPMSLTPVSCLPAPGSRRPALWWGGPSALNIFLSKVAGSS